MWNDMLGSDAKIIKGVLVLLAYFTAVVLLAYFVGSLISPR